MANNVVNWFELYVSDMQRAKKFYGDVFKVSFTDLPGTTEYATFPGDMNGWGCSGALAKMEMMPPGKGGTLVYFTTPEILTEQGRVEAAGGKVLQPKRAIGEFGFIAIVQDSEGNIIGLHSMK